MVRADMTDNEPREVGQAYERAEKIVAEKIGFFRHVIVYVAVNVILFAINMITSSGFLWFLLPLAGWGILLLAHFLVVFAFRGERFERWRRREIEKEMEKLGKRD